MQNDHLGWGRTWSAPAKLNLMLRIVGRRPDGYHLLQTVFQFVELSDMISFYPADDGSVTRLNTLVDVPEQDDLTVRAANLLKAETGCELGVKIKVDKRIPMGGGLGGGSSDAATALVVLNRLWGLNLSSEKLMQLGLRLGADVPIFVHGHAAWAEGVGEEIVDICPKEQWIVLIKPDCHVNTGEIFSTKELTRNSKSIRISDFMAGQQRNDCLEVVCQKYPSVERALTELSKYSEAKLTGTGACVFAQFDSEEIAVSVCQSIAKVGELFLTKSVNKSPLFFELNSGY